MLRRLFEAVVPDLARVNFMSINLIVQHEVWKCQ